MNKEQKFYTEERLQKVLDGISGEASVKEILTEVKDDIVAFADGAEQSDDITMLGVMFCGKESLAESLAGGRFVFDKSGTMVL
jgi:sigma-B regulation protein RsbU (phosphoserine phosphatase)